MLARNIKTNEELQAYLENGLDKYIFPGRKTPLVVKIQPHPDPETVIEAGGIPLSVELLGLPLYTWPIEVERKTIGGMYKARVVGWVLEKPWETMATRWDPPDGGSDPIGEHEHLWQALHHAVDNYVKEAFGIWRESEWAEEDREIAEAARRAREFGYLP